VALNKVQLKQLWGALLAVLLLLVCDQSSKVWVKTHMQLHEMIEVFSWFKIFFVENPGMAFGIELVDTYILTIFRVIVVSWFCVMIVKLIKRGTFKFGYILCLSFILAGALGNIIDCAFYGMLFDHSYGQVASFMPDEGYSTFLNGKVVDMLYFPLIRTIWPSWMPVWGGQEFVFFRPIFNIADSAICVSAFILLIFYKHSLFASLAKEKKTNDE
jgi:signal peptidase II